MSEETVARLAELRESFRRQGLLKKDTRRCLLELAFHVAIALIGVAIVILGDSVLLDVGGCIISTLGSLGVVTNGHTASHHGTSDSRRLNEALTLFCYPFFVGVSASSWYNRHVVIHHPAPNVLGQDEDIDLMPFFAYSRKEVESASPLWQRYYRYQWIFFPFALCLNGFNVYRTAWCFLIWKLRDRRLQKPGHWVDLAMLLAHGFTWFLLPMIHFRVSDVLVFNVCRIAFMGFGMFALFAPAHWPAAARAVASSGTADDFILVQTANTVNFRTRWYGRLLCSGVEYQIDHHLFPNVSHTRYPMMSPQIAAFCERYGYPYRVLNWAEAVRESLKTMRFPKEGEPSLASLRQRVRAELAPGASSASSP